MEGHPSEVSHENENETVDDDFYLRYYVGYRSGNTNHSFTEFEVYASGKLRYARRTASEQDHQPVLRRELHLNAAVVEEFKRLITASNVIDLDDQKWPEPANDLSSGRQELECKVGRHHIAYTTVQLNNLSDIQATEDASGLTVFQTLTTDLLELVSTLIDYFFEAR